MRKIIIFSSMVTLFFMQSNFVHASSARLVLKNNDARAMQIQYKDCVWSNTATFCGSAEEVKIG